MHSSSGWTRMLPSDDYCRSSIDQIRPLGEDSDPPTGRISSVVIVPDA